MINDNECDGCGLYVQDLAVKAFACQEKFERRKEEGKKREARSRESAGRGKKLQRRGQIALQSSQLGQFNCKSTKLHNCRLLEN